jgi:hypothetical protein
MYINPLNNFFTNELTNKEAWLLGWIYSDGHLDKYTLRFKLQGRDVDVLEKFCKVFGVEKEPKFYKNKFVGITFSSIKMMDNIEKFGVPRGKKSDIVKPLKLSDDLMPHFWRGVWEGDGSISIHEDKRRTSPYRFRFRTTLTGNINTCKGFKNQVLKTDNKIIKMVSGASQTAKESTQLEFWANLYDYFYDGYTLHENIYLNRKHDKFLEIFDKIGDIYEKDRKNT